MSVLTLPKIFRPITPNTFFLFGLTILYTGLYLRVNNKNLIFLFLNQNIVVGTQKDRLIETVLLSTQNIY